MKKTKKPQAPGKYEAESVKDFFDLISPSVIKFFTDYYIVGDSYRCVWAIREYPPTTETQALLAQLADRSGVTVRMYHRLVDAGEQRKIVQNPKFQMKEQSNMANTRTIAFQVPEELYQRIKEYLVRNSMTQKQFFLGLIETELEREQEELDTARLAEQDNGTPTATEYADGVPVFSDYGAASPEQYSEQYEEAALDNDEAQGFGLSM